MLSIVETFAVTHPYLVYMIIILVALAEGPFLATFCGMLLSVGLLRLFPLLLAITVGNIIGDVIWYFIGCRVGHPFVNRFGKYFGLQEPDISKIENLFTKHQYPILFISKISNGFGLAIVVLFTAGLSRVPFMPFIGINIIGETIWSGGLIAIGYFFSASLLQAQDTFHRIWVVISLCAIVWVFFLGRRYLRSKILNKKE